MLRRSAEHLILIAKKTMFLALYFLENLRAISLDRKEKKKKMRRNLYFPRISLSSPFPFHLQFNYDLLCIRAAFTLVFLWPSMLVCVHQRLLSPFFLLISLSDDSFLCFLYNARLCRWKTTFGEVVNK